MGTSYTSEYTRFIDEFLAKQPKVTEEQIRSRARLWDVQLNLEEQAGFKASEVSVKSCLNQSE